MSKIENYLPEAVVQAFCDGVPLLVGTSSKNGAPIPHDKVEAFVAALQKHESVQVIRVMRCHETKFADYRHPDVVIPEGVPPLEITARAIFNTYSTRGADGLWTAFTEESLLTAAGLGIGADSVAGQAQLKAQLEAHVQQYLDAHRIYGEADADHKIFVEYLQPVRDIRLALDGLTVEQEQNALIALLCPTVVRLGVSGPEAAARMLAGLSEYGASLRTEADRVSTDPLAEHPDGHCCPDC